MMMSKECRFFLVEKNASGVSYGSMDGAIEAAVKAKRDCFVAELIHEVRFVPQVEDLRDEKD
jgi:hypothetical protein